MMLELRLSFQQMYFELKKIELKKNKNCEKQIYSEPAIEGWADSGH